MVRLGTDSNNGMNSREQRGVRPEAPTVVAGFFGLKPAPLAHPVVAAMRFQTSIRTHVLSAPRAAHNAVAFGLEAGHIPPRHSLVVHCSPAFFQISCA